MQHAGLWKDKVRAAEYGRTLSGLKREVEKWERVEKERDELEELTGLAGEDETMQKELSGRIGVLERQISELETGIFLSGPYDKGNAVVSLYAGAGGKDAEDWAALLFRMYRRYAERKGWRVKIVHEHWGENRGPGGWGIKNAALLLIGASAYGLLKKESGVHRLVRISPFSAQSLRHTSFVLVDMMPEFVEPGEISVDPADIQIDFFRSSGPGGQNVNKRETAVRIRHIPTGVQASAQSERSQERNREMAMELLRSKLWRRQKTEQEEEVGKMKQEKRAIEWGSQIRSYVMHPYQMVKDHRTNVETSQIDAVLDGELEEFIEAEIRSSI